MILNLISRYGYRTKQGGFTIVSLIMIITKYSVRAIMFNRDVNDLRCLLICEVMYLSRSLIWFR